MCTSMECKSLAFRKPCGYFEFAVDPIAFIGAPSFFSLPGLDGARSDDKKLHAYYFIVIKHDRVYIELRIE